MKERPISNALWWFISSFCFIVVRCSLTRLCVCDTRACEPPRGERTHRGSAAARPWPALRPSSGRFRRSTRWSAPLSARDQPCLSASLPSVPDRVIESRSKRITETPGSHGLRGLVRSQGWDFITREKTFPINRTARRTWVSHQHKHVQMLDTTKEEEV